MLRLIFLVAVLLAGCGIDKADIGVETPPLRLSPNGTVPADSTESLYDRRGLALVTMFNREFDAGEISTLQLVPRPPVMGTIHNPAEIARQMRIDAVVLDTAYVAYRLVLDGPAMPRPEILSYYSSVRSFRKDASIGGHVFISRGPTQPENILVYALVPPGLDDEFPLTGSEETILGRPVVGVTRTLVTQTEEGGWYRLAGLGFHPYLVLAILDTTGDGEYRLDEDWWGYWRDAVNAPLEVVAGVPFGALLEPPLPSQRVDIDFWILPPGSLNPQFEP